MRILIVDNDNHWAVYTKDFLERTGHSIVYVNDSKKAYEKIENADFDFIFYDSRILKENHNLLCQLLSKGIISKVIVTAALPNYKDAMYAKRIGAADYINKIFEYEEIRDALNKNINNTPLNKVYLEKRLKEEECL